MNDKKERVYSEQDLCEYTILQKIDELERQLQNLKSETSTLYETKVDANNSHSTLSDNIASVDSNLQLHIEENARKFRDIDNAFNHIDKFTPTDVGIKNNKLGLQNGSTWLTNRNAINIGDGLAYDETTNTLKANGGISVEGGISVIELTDKNGTIASTQLDKINANPQNFAFKYKRKILLFTSADSTTYQYCNNTTSSSDNNVMTASILLTITSNTGAYTIAEEVHNVVANSIHQVNGGNLTNIQVGSKVYSIPSGGGELTGDALMNVTKDSDTVTRALDTDGKVKFKSSLKYKSNTIIITFQPKEYNIGDMVHVYDFELGSYNPVCAILPKPQLISGIEFIAIAYQALANELSIMYLCVKGGTLSEQKKFVVTPQCWYI